MPARIPLIHGGQVPLRQTGDYTADTPELSAGDTGLGDALRSVGKLAGTVGEDLLKKKKADEASKTPAEEVTDVLETHEKLESSQQRQQQFEQENDDVDAQKANLENEKQTFFGWLGSKFKGDKRRMSGVTPGVEAHYGREVQRIEQQGEQRKHQKTLDMLLGNIRKAGETGTEEDVATAQRLVTHSGLGTSEFWQPHYEAALGRIHDRGVARVDEELTALQKQENVPGSLELIKRGRQSKALNQEEFQTREKGIQRWSSVLELQKQVDADPDVLDRMDDQALARSGLSTLKGNEIRSLRERQQTSRKRQGLAGAARVRQLVDDLPVEQLRLLSATQRHGLPEAEQLKNASPKVIESLKHYAKVKLGQTSGYAPVQFQRLWTEIAEYDPDNDQDGQELTELELRVGLGFSESEQKRLGGFLREQKDRTERTVEMGPLFKQVDARLLPAMQTDDPMAAIRAGYTSKEAAVAAGRADWIKKTLFNEVLRGKIDTEEQAQARLQDLLTKDGTRLDVRQAFNFFRPRKVVAEVTPEAFDLEMGELKKKAPMSRIYEREARYLRDHWGRIPEADKPWAQALMARYGAQQEDAGLPLWPRDFEEDMEAHRRLRFLFGSPGDVDQSVPGLAQRLQSAKDPETERLRIANALFLSQKLGRDVDDVTRDYEFYRDAYAKQAWTDGQYLTDKAFYHRAGKDLGDEWYLKNQEQDAGIAGTKAALLGTPKLQALLEWQKSLAKETASGKPPLRAFLKAYEENERKISPYRHILGQAVHALRSQRDGQGTPEDQSRVDRALVVMAGMTARDRRTALQWMALHAAPIGENAKHEKNLFQEFGESAYRTVEDMFGTGADKNLKRWASELSWDGQILTAVPEITSHEQAVQLVQEQLFRRKLLSIHVPSAEVALEREEAKQSLRSLTESEKKFAIEAQRIALNYFGMQAEVMEISRMTDPIRDGWASQGAATFGSSVAGMGISLLGPGGSILAAAGYANAEEDRLMREYPDMEEKDAQKISLISGIIQAGLDKLQLNALSRMPSLRNLLTGGLTRELAKRAALGTLANYGFESATEAAQDATTMAVHHLIATMNQDVPGVDWEREMAEFWSGRLDVAVGMIPLTLLGSGFATVKDFNGARNMLEDDRMLATAGFTQADREIIVGFAAEGNLEQAHAAMRDAFDRRDPGIAARALEDLPDAEAAKTDAEALLERKGATFTQGSEGWSLNFDGGESVVIGDWSEARQILEDSPDRSPAAAANNSVSTDSSALGQSSAPATTTGLTGAPQTGAAPRQQASPVIAQPGMPSAQESERLQFSQGRQASSPGQRMQDLAADEARFRRGSASTSKDLKGIAEQYALGDELKSIQPAANYSEIPTVKDYQIAVKSGGEAYLHHGRDGIVWVDTLGMRATKGRRNKGGADGNASQEDVHPSQGGDLVYQTALTYAHNNGLKFIPDPQDVKPIAKARRISHLLSSALRHGTTRHIQGSGVNVRDGKSYAEVANWREEKSRADFDHNLEQLALAEMQYVQEAMKTRGETRLEDLQWNPADDSVTNVATGRRLSKGDFDQIVSRLDPGRSGVGPTTLSRALVTRQALQSMESAPGGKLDQHASERHDGRGDLDRSSTSLFRMLADRPTLFYSQPGRQGGSTIRERISDRRKLSESVSKATRFLNKRLPGLLNENTHVFSSVQDLLASDYARRNPFTEKQRAALNTAEGFFDKDTGKTVIIAENISLRPGESVRSGMARVVLHERIGHDGLNTLLGKGGLYSKRWDALRSQIPSTELDAIAQEDGYRHLSGDPHALALEWFARKAETDMRLLESQPLLKQMWETLKQAATDLMAKWGIDRLNGKDLDTQVREMMNRARAAAVKSARNVSGGEMQFSHAGGRNANPEAANSVRGHSQTSGSSETVQPRRAQPEAGAKPTAPAQASAETHVRRTGEVATSRPGQDSRSKEIQSKLDATRPVTAVSPRPGQKAPQAVLPKQVNHPQLGPVKMPSAQADAKASQNTQAMAGSNPTSPDGKRETALPQAQATSIQSGAASSRTNAVPTFSGDPQMQALQPHLPTLISQATVIATRQNSDGTTTHTLAHPVELDGTKQMVTFDVRRDADGGWVMEAEKLEHGRNNIKKSSDTSPSVPSQTSDGSPFLPTANHPRTVEKAVEILTPLRDEYASLEKQKEDLRKKKEVFVERNKPQVPPSHPSSWAGRAPRPSLPESKKPLTENEKAQIEEINRQVAEIEINQQQCMEAARNLLSVPPNEKGDIRLTDAAGMSQLHPEAQFSAENREAFRAGAELARRYIHSSLLPTEIVLARTTSARPEYRSKDNMILFPLKTINPSSVLHEITHGTEVEKYSASGNPGKGLMKKAYDFLIHRASGQPAVPLNTLVKPPFQTYDPNEIGYEDDWVNKGGKIYTGKVYPDGGTEIFTTGIERLHANPLEFMQNDPEFFTFIVSNLRYP